MDSITIINQGKTLAIKTDYNTGSFEIRKIQGAKWVSSTKEWHVPVEMQKEVDAVFEKKKSKKIVTIDSVIDKSSTIDIDAITIDNQSTIQDYTDKSIVVYGSQPNEIKNEFIKIGGLHNMRLRNGEGWIFKKSSREKVESIISNITKDMVKEIVMEKPKEVTKETIKSIPTFYETETNFIKAVERNENSVRIYADRSMIDFSIREGYNEFDIFSISDESFKRYAKEIFSKPIYMTDDIMKTMNRHIKASQAMYTQSSYNVMKDHDRVIISSGDDVNIIIESTPKMIRETSPEEFLYFISNPIYVGENFFKISTDNRRLDINDLHTFKYMYVNKSIIFENDTMKVTISDDDIYAYDDRKFFDVLRKIINGEKTQEFNINVEKKFVPFQCQR